MPTGPHYKEILEKVALGQIPAEEAEELLKDANNSQLSHRLYCKVSPKGGLSLYGLQRFPTTLYVTQWERLLAFVDEIRKFIAEHEHEFKRKPDGWPQPKTL